IIADGWTLSILSRELAALYDAKKNGRPSPLQEPAIQYADFAIWQRQWLQGETLEAQRRYWRKRLAGCPQTELPVDHPRSPHTTSAGAAYDFELPASLAQRLRELSRRAGVAMFMTLTAGFKALLARYTGQDDIAVGTPVANRTHVELESVAGFFANTL